MHVDLGDLGDWNGRFGILRGVRTIWERLRRSDWMGMRLGRFTVRLLSCEMDVDFSCDSQERCAFN